MKKKVLIALLALTVAVSAMGCGSKKSDSEDSTKAKTESSSEEKETAEEVETDSDGHVVAVDTDDITKYVTLGDYKNLSVKVPKTEVTDDSISEYINEQLTYKPEEITEDRAVQENDTVNIDYTGYMDGEEFSGGSATDTDLLIGSGQFIDGFESGLIGAKKGDEVTLNLKFPDNYSSADLAGQEVVFHVKLNQLKSEADSKVDDDLAKRYYNDDTATLDQLKEEVRAELQAEADSQFFNAAGSELLNEVINNSEVTADPDAVDDMFNQLKNTYSSYASSYGLEFDQFLSMFLGTDEDGLRDTAENLVKQQIILNAIQAEENLSATDEQKDKLAVMNYFKNAAQMITTYGEDSAKQIFDMGAVYYYLIDNSTYVEAPETEAETTEAENILEEKETAAEESESSSAAN